MDVFATRELLWEVIENKCWEVSQHVEEMRTQKMQLQAAMFEQHKTQHAATKAAEKLPAKKEPQKVELTPTSRLMAQGPVKPRRQRDLEEPGFKLEFGNQVASYIQEAKKRSIRRNYPRHGR